MKKHVLFLLSVFLMFSGLVTFIHAEEVETGPEESTEEPGGDLCFGFSDPSYAVIGENGAGTDAEKGIESDELTSFSADAASEADGILGFFRWLTKFTGVSEDVRKDANVAVMILTNDSNLTKDPVYIGAGARGIPQSISELMANDTDYNDLSYLTQSLELIRECNELRRTDPNFKNTDGSDLLPLKVSSQLMAMSMLQLNWSSNVIDHSEYFNVGENLAWGYPDPFRGWYDEEKELYESGEQIGTGHYRNICQRSYEATGFAIAKKNCMYDIAHGQVFTSFQLDGALSVDDYEKLVAAYLADISPDKPDPTPSPVPTATPVPEPTVPPTPTPESGKVHMFRMYNPNSGEHFYTGN
ncbi:MAG: CAP domain-containing protein, partial [Solobacterium sp.]|nr:CAP domain-containing protein [Solobacterium sp.]